jgi:hypothetical protein
MREEELGNLHQHEVKLQEAAIDLEAYRVKENRAKRIALCPMAVEILRKQMEEAKAQRPDDPCMFGRGDGRPIVLDGHPWKEGLCLGDTARKIQKRLRRRGLGFWKHYMDPKKERRIAHLRIALGWSYPHIMAEEGVAFRTIKAIEKKYETKRKEPVETQPAPAMPHWSMHDLRRTFETKVVECGATETIAARCVGHQVAKMLGLNQRVMDTYNKHDYFIDKLAAVRRWEDRFRQILAGTAQEVIENRPVELIEAPVLAITDQSARSEV